MKFQQHPPYLANDQARPDSIWNEAYPQRVQNRRDLLLHHTNQMQEVERRVDATFRAIVPNVHRPWTRNPLI